MNKIIFLIFAVLMANCACQKDTTTEPCIGTQTTCWHIVINSWTICPDPDNPGETMVTACGGPITIDTLSTCDTSQWLATTRKWNQDYMNFGTPESQKLKKEYPSTCGCN